MVDRGADNRQAKGDVHRRAEAFVLEHGQALIVVHGQHRIAVFQVLGGEQGVGGQRADQVQAVVTQARQARLDDVDFLAAHVPAFAGMGVEAADQDARRGNAELVDQVGMQDAGDPLQALRRDGVGDIAQGQVGGHQRNTQAMGGEHHHHLFGVGQLGQVFGVAREGDASLVDHAFVYGRCDHPGKVAVDAAGTCAVQGFQYISGVGRVQLAGHHGSAQWRVPDVQATCSRRLLGPVAGLDRD